jgi:DNA-binding Lrp family transcriptional regulator
MIFSLIMKLKLSKNERFVLECLIDDGRMSRTEIAKKIGLTSQAIGKIERKLIGGGVIRGYSADVDYEKLGIEVFAVAHFRLKSGSWNRLENEDIKKRVNGPHLINVYRFNDGNITHMVVYGFRNMREAENYLQTLQTQRGHISELIKVNIISSESVLKHSMKELLIKVLREYDLDALASPEKPSYNELSETT